MALPKILGIDPDTEKDVTLRKGPFGFYIQLGEPEGKQKPKRATLLKNFSPMEVTLEIALALLALPRDIGLHPETGEMIQAGIGRYGPYLKVGPAYTSLGPDEGRPVDWIEPRRNGHKGKTTQKAWSRNGTARFGHTSSRWKTGRRLQRPLRPLC